MRDRPSPTIPSLWVKNWDRWLLFLNDRRVRLTCTWSGVPLTFSHNPPLRGVVGKWNSPTPVPHGKIRDRLDQRVCVRYFPTPVFSGPAVHQSHSSGVGQIPWKPAPLDAVKNNTVELCAPEAPERFVVGVGKIRKFPTRIDPETLVSGRRVRFPHSGRPSSTPSSTVFPRPRSGKTADHARSRAAQFHCFPTGTEVGLMPALPQGITPRAAENGSRKGMTTKF